VALSFLCWGAACTGDGDRDPIDAALADHASRDGRADTAGGEVAPGEIVADSIAPGEVVADSTSVDVQSTETTADAPGEETHGSGLPQGIHELAGFDPALPLTDLDPLGGIIGDAQVVALGESIHTSKGYYQAKHRVFRYLVEEKGFRGLAFETNWTPAMNIEAYGQSCQGDPVELVVDNLIYTWTGQSVADLIEWMCEYNQAHSDDPVHFFGFDIQQTWLDGPLLTAFLELVAGDMAAPLSAGIGKCRCTTSPSHEDCKALYGELGPISDEEKQECLAALEAVESWLDDHEAEVLLAASVEELEYARLHLVGIEKNTVKNYHKLQGEYGLMYGERDWGMAHVFNKLREMHFPDDRMALWAQNWHIAHQTDLMTEPAVTVAPIPVGLQAATGMGTLLRQQLGDDYLAVGLHAYQVAINWEGLRQGDLGPHADESLEGMLHALDRPALLVDLAFPGADEPFLDKEASYPAAIFEGVGTGVPVVPARQYGAILFLDESPMMDPLMW